MRADVSIVSLLYQALGAFAWGHKNWNWFDHRHQVVDHFKWQNPFPSDGADPMGFEVTCDVLATFHAKQYTVKELVEDTDYAFVVGNFGWNYGTRRYPGSWDGVDQGGDKRDVVMMEYNDVPEPAREWIESHQNEEDPAKSWLFRVYEKRREAETEFTEGQIGDGDQIWGLVKPTSTEGKLVFFAPAALYEILPLFVAKGSSCEVDFLDLTKYGPRAKHNGVIAYPERHAKPDLRHDISIRIKAQKTIENPDAMHWRLIWEKTHMSWQRDERRRKRKEQVAERQQLSGDTGVKDEL
ncbi:hypothetical protein NKR23_g6419 [Pleurostoma richardsiae]|uniref:Uncharacterized protein n=1 Tax=Pleurostoma richardsiae TaxID=41990 RepID=A0AA38RPT0_9PEZI|nr:hypothetical protein NKR23_g6419 [Pleurostoma richardsiae]